MGAVIVTIMLGYLLVSVGIAILIYKFSKKRIIPIVVFIGLITFPFWDIIAQKAIKTYYINSGLLESKIYAMPEKDGSRRIDGLSLIEVTKKGNHWLKNNEDIKELLVNKYAFLENSQLKSLDLRFKYGKYPDYTYKKLHFRYNHSTNTPIVEYIKKSNARYKIIFQDSIKLIGLYKLRKYQVIDVNTNKILAESTALYMNNKYSYIRTNIFLLTNYGGSSISFVRGVGNWFSLIEIFGLKYKSLVKQQ